MKNRSSSHKFDSIIAQLENWISKNPENKSTVCFLLDKTQQTNSDLIVETLNKGWSVHYIVVKEREKTTTTGKRPISRPVQTTHKAARPGKTSAK